MYLKCSRNKPLNGPAPGLGEQPSDEEIGRLFLFSHSAALSLLAFIVVARWVPQLQASYLYTHVQRQAGVGGRSFSVSLFISEENLAQKSPSRFTLKPR